MDMVFSWTDLTGKPRAKSARVKLFPARASMILAAVDRVQAGGDDEAFAIGGVDGLQVQVRKANRYEGWEAGAIVCASRHFPYVSNPLSVDKIAKLVSYLESV